MPYWDTWAARHYASKLLTALEAAPPTGLMVDEVDRLFGSMRHYKAPAVRYLRHQGHDVICTPARHLTRYRLLSNTAEADRQGDFLGEMRRVLRVEYVQVVDRYRAYADTDKVNADEVVTAALDLGRLLRKPPTMVMADLGL